MRSRPNISVVIAIVDVMNCRVYFLIDVTCITNLSRIHCCVCNVRVKCGITFHVVYWGWANVHLGRCSLPQDTKDLWWSTQPPTFLLEFIPHGTVKDNVARGKYSLIHRRQTKRPVFAGQVMPQVKPNNAYCGNCLTSTQGTFSPQRQNCISWGCVDVFVVHITSYQLEQQNLQHKTQQNVRYKV